MSEDFYSPVQRRIWNDAGFRKLSRPAPNARDLFLYLLTTPHATQVPGLISLGEAAMAEDLDWPLAGLRKALAELETVGMVKVDRAARLLWMPKALRHNPPRSSDNIRGWAKHWRMLPECPLLREAAETMMAVFATRGPTFSEAFSRITGLPMVHPKEDPMGDPMGPPKGDPQVAPPPPPPPRPQIQDQDQDQDPEIPPTPRGAGGGGTTLPFLPGMGPAVRGGKREKTESEQAYSDAYVAGQEDAEPGCGFRPLPVASCRLIGAAAQAHAKDRFKQRLTGDALLAWIRETSAEFRRAAEPQYAKGYSAHAFGAWLDAGRPTTRREPLPAPPSPPRSLPVPPPPRPVRRMTPEQQAEHLARYLASQET